MSVFDWEELWEYKDESGASGFLASPGDQNRTYACLYSYHIKIEPESEDLILL